MGRRKSVKSPQQVHREYNERQKALRNREREHILSLGKYDAYKHDFRKCQENPKKFLEEKNMSHLIFQRTGQETAWLKYNKKKKKIEAEKYQLIHSKAIYVYDKTGKPTEYKSIYDAWNTYGLFDYKEYNNNKSGLILYYSQDSVFDKILELIEKNGRAKYSPYTVKFKEDK